MHTGIQYYIIDNQFSAVHRFSQELAGFTYLPIFISMVSDVIKSGSFFMDYEYWKSKIRLYGVMDSSEMKGSSRVDPAIKPQENLKL